MAIITEVKYVSSLLAVVGGLCVEMSWLCPASVKGFEEYEVS